jgi:hypothetical protein
MSGVGLPYGTHGLSRWYICKSLWSGRGLNLRPLSGLSLGRDGLARSPMVGAYKQ